MERGPEEATSVRPGATAAIAQPDLLPAPVAPTPEPRREETFLERLRTGLGKTREQLIGRLDQVLFRRGSVERVDLEELEEVLLSADIGVKTTYQLLSEMESELKNGASSPDRMKEVIKGGLLRLLTVESAPLDPDRLKPFIVMVVGVNGVGKTTTIGKLGALFGSQGKKVMFVAADTFRAAAIEQLEIWSHRVGADLVKHKSGADPSAVAYDGVHAAISRKTDVVILDTAGRLHTKANLMEELKKVKRILARECAGAPHEILLVLDATGGQNAIVQSKAFHEALGVGGIVLTKMDGTSKGGVIIGITAELNIPIRFIGIGEGLDDLKPFEPMVFVEALFNESGKQKVQ
ncbi:MAG: signal recognition particle-docking protein FtsY [bacterium]